MDGLGDAEVDDLGDRHAVVERDHHVGGLDVAMDDPLLMGVLHGLADLDEQLQPLAVVRLILVAVIREGDAVDQLHHEVGPARFGRARVKHLGDVGVVHHGQGLPLGLEAGDHLPGVHARLDDLQGHLAANRLPLLGHVDHAHAPFADLLQELVAADGRARAFGDGRQVEVAAMFAGGDSRKLPAPSIRGQTGRTSARETRDSPHRPGAGIRHELRARAVAQH